MKWRNTKPEEREVDYMIQGFVVEPEDGTEKTTIYGYEIEHLIFLSEILRREHIDPEQVSLLFADASLVMKSVIDEMERKMRETFEKAVR
jgi:hypothetical protein